jgi:hypothetical protein
MKKIISHPLKILTLLLALAVALTACNLPGSEGQTTPTLSVTQAYQTVEAKLTEAVALTPSLAPTQPPSPTPAITDTPSPTTAPTSIITPTQAAATIAPPAVSCDKVLPGLPKIDATIDDDTQMQPGQAFTKTWRLYNAGTCAWSKSYAVVYAYGDLMGAQQVVPLKGNVDPGQTVEVSVDMVAPSTPGTYQGNWKLRNAANASFGIGPAGSSPFWVRIVVVQGATSTATTTITATPPLVTPTNTPTVAPTPGALASGSASLAPGNTLDLDTNQVGGGDADLSYASDPGGSHLLVPQGSTLIGIYGTDQPGLAACQGASLGAAAVVADTLQVGTYLCYRTTQGHYGRALVTNFVIDTFTLSLNIFTWSAP